MADNEEKQTRRRRGPTKAQREAEAALVVATGEIETRDRKLSRSRKKRKELNARIVEQEDEIARLEASQGGNRIVNHAAHGASAVAGTVMAEFIQDSEFAKDKLDEPIKARAIPAVLGALVAVVGGDFLGDPLADSIAMGLMAPAEVTLGEMLYEKMTDQG